MNITDMDSESLMALDSAVRGLIDAQTIYQILLLKDITTIDEINHIRKEIINNTETGELLQRIERESKDKKGD